MKATIDEAGILTVEAESILEAFALNLWRLDYFKAYPGFAALKIVSVYDQKIPELTSDRNHKIKEKEKFIAQAKPKCQLKSWYFAILPGINCSRGCVHIRHANRSGALSLVRSYFNPTPGEDQENYLYSSFDDVPNDHKTVRGHIENNELVWHKK